MIMFHLTLFGVSAILSLFCQVGGAKTWIPITPMDVGKDTVSSDVYASGVVWGNDEVIVLAGATNEMLLYELTQRKPVLSGKVTVPSCLAVSDLKSADDHLYVGCPDGGLYAYKLPITDGQLPVKWLNMSEVMPAGSHINSYDNGIMFISVGLVGVPGLLFAGSAKRFKVFDISNPSTMSLLYVNEWYLNNIGEPPPNFMAVTPNTQEAEMRVSVFSSHVHGNATGASMDCNIYDFSFDDVYGFTTAGMRADTWLVVNTTVYTGGYALGALYYPEGDVSGGVVTLSCSYPNTSDTARTRSVYYKHGFIYSLTTLGAFAFREDSACPIILNEPFDEQNKTFHVTNSGYMYVVDRNSISGRQVAVLAEETSAPRTDAPPTGIPTTEIPSTTAPIPQTDIPQTTTTPLPPPRYTLAPKDSSPAMPIWAIVLIAAGVIALVGGGAGYYGWIMRHPSTGSSHATPTHYEMGVDYDLAQFSSTGPVNMRTATSHRI